MFKDINRVQIGTLSRVRPIFVMLTKHALGVCVGGGGRDVCFYCQLPNPFVVNMIPHVHASNFEGKHSLGSETYCGYNCMWKYTLY